MDPETHRALTLTLASWLLFESSSVNALGEPCVIVAVRTPSVLLSHRVPFTRTEAVGVSDVFQVTLLIQVDCPICTSHGLAYADIVPVGNVAGCTVTVVHVAPQLLSSFDSGTDPVLVGDVLSAHTRM